MARSAEQTAEATVRAFFAVELSPEARNAADDVASELRGQAAGDGVKWVRPENFHVTLRFLGDVPQSRVSLVSECAIAAIAGSQSSHEPFEMCLGEVHGFPSQQWPRVVTLDITPQAPLEALADSLDRGVGGLAFAGLSRNERKRPFRAHLTLGRVRRGGRSPSLDGPRPTRSAPTRVNEIVLFRSELAQAGPSYTRLERIPLANLGNRN